MRETPLSPIYPLLSRYNSAFYTFVDEMADPVYSTSVPTAAVCFDLTNPSLPVKFLINPEFWKSLTLTEKLFVFIHETLHVLFNHGVRGKKFLDSIPDDLKNARLLNVAQDICINEIIVTQYLKDIPRFLLPILNSVCLIETVFPDHHDKVERDRSFDYYYLKYLELYPDQSADDIVNTFDSHMFNDSPIPEEILDALADRLLPDRQGDVTEEEFVKERQLNAKEHGESKIDDSNTRVIERTALTKEELLHRKLKIAVATATGKHISSLKYNWCKDSRRVNASFAGGGLILPSTYEKSTHKYRIVVYADVSGSCEHLSKKFLSMVAALPEDQFSVEFYVFADRVAEAKVQGKRVKYSGAGFGTQIYSVINHFNQLVKSRNPDGVLVLTDGEYSNIRNMPDKDFEKWHFFFTHNGYQNAPVHSKRYSI